MVCVMEEQHVVLCTSLGKEKPRTFPALARQSWAGMEILSPFGKENLEADARAFAAFMRHLREVDTNEHTVIMVQVENEIGSHPWRRRYCREQCEWSASVSCVSISKPMRRWKAMEALFTGDEIGRASCRERV